MTATVKGIVLLVLVYCFFVLVTLTLWNHGLSDAAGSADLIQPYLVTEDLLRYPDTYHRWRHSPAPYVFPDWIFAGILMVVPSIPVWNNILYAAAVASGFAFTAGWIVNQATQTRFSQAVVIAALTLVAMQWGSIGLEAENNLERIFLKLLLPFIHNGATFGVLLAIALIGKTWSKPTSKLATILLGLVVFLTAYSDLLFVLWFIVPASATYMLRAAITGRAFHILTAIYLVVIALAAVALKRVLHRVNSVKPLEITSIQNSINEFTRDVQTKLANDDILMVLLFAGVAGTIFFGLYSFVLAIRNRSMTFPQALFIMLLGTLVCATAMPVLGGYFERPARWRYFIVTPMIVALAVGLFIAYVLPSRGRFQVLPETLFAALFLASAVPAVRVALALEQKNEMESCLEAQGLTTGFAEYWSSKNLIYYSERRIHIIQIDKTGELDGLNYNQIWFERRADGTPWNSPNFIIMRRLNSEKILAKFGNPERRIKCAEQDVWIYEEIVHPSLQQQTKN